MDDGKIREGTNLDLQGKPISEAKMDEIRAASGQPENATMHLNVQFSPQDLANMIQALAMLAAHYRQHAMVMMDAGAPGAAQQFAELANQTVMLIRKFNGADIQEAQPGGAAN